MSRRRRHSRMKALVSTNEHYERSLLAIASSLIGVAHASPPAFALVA
jgi:hypothetical protein